MNNDNAFSNDWIFTFGKYKGETIDKISDIDPEYLGYCLDTVSWFGMQDETLAAQCLEMYLDGQIDNDDDCSLTELDFN